MATSVSARLAVVSLVITFSATSAAAQNTNVTLRQAVDEIARAWERVNPGFDTEEPDLARQLTDALQALDDSGVLDAPLRPLAEGRRVDFLSAAGRKQRTYESTTFLASPTLRGLWNTVRTVRNRNQGTGTLPQGQPRGLLRRLQDDPDIDNATIGAMFVAYNEVDDLLQRLALGQAMDRLGRYERKFGPGSVQLNAIEVALSYAFQRVKGFGYDLEDGPGPWEVVASYTTAYFTYAEDTPQVVSASEFGLRHYNFGEGWGGDGLQGYLKPGHFAFGMAVAGEKDGPLVWPWRGDSRMGTFFAWGDLKVAYVGGDNSRWLVTQQFQIIPLAF